MVIEIIHWPVVLMVQKRMLTLEVFRTRTLKNMTPWGYVLQWEIPSSIASCHIGWNCVVNFCFNYLSVSLLWFSWIVTSHNYNQAKFNLICAIFCLVLIPELDGPLLSYIKNTAIYRLVVEDLVVWYQQVVLSIEVLSKGINLEVGMVGSIISFHTSTECVETLGYFS